MNCRVSPENPMKAHLWPLGPEGKDTVNRRAGDPHYKLAARKLCCKGHLLKNSDRVSRETIKKKMQGSPYDSLFLEFSWQ